MHANSSKTPLNLLHIDDNTNDLALFQAATRKTGNRFTVYTANGAQSATAYFELRRHNSGRTIRPRPALVLLDYELGNHTGADFLFWVRVIRGLTQIPVIMYSGSSGLSQVSECYAAGANYFLRKAETPQAIENIVRTLGVCMCFKPHRFNLLTRLGEYEADPRIDQVSSVAAA